MVRISKLKTCKKKKKKMTVDVSLQSNKRIQ